MSPAEATDTEHEVPAGVTDGTVEAVGALTEALEKVERARGALYEFHQLSGAADLKLGEAVSKLREAGHDGLADRLDRELVGRNVLHGRWTYQVVEEYDDGYWTPFRRAERQVRQELVQGRRHLLEARMKSEEISPGEPGHELTPQSEAGTPDRGRDEE